MKTITVGHRKHLTGSPTMFFDPEDAPPGEYVPKAAYLEAVACLRDLWTELDTDAEDFLGPLLAARVRGVLEAGGG